MLEDCHGLPLWDGWTMMDHQKKDTSMGPSLHPEGLHGMSLNRSDQHLHRPSIHDPPIHNLTSLSPIYQAAHSVRKCSTIFTRYISRFSLTTICWQLPCRLLSSSQSVSCRCFAPPPASAIESTLFSWPWSHGRSLWILLFTLSEMLHSTIDVFRYAKNVYPLYPLFVNSNWPIYIQYPPTKIGKSKCKWHLPQTSEDGENLPERLPLSHPWWWIHSAPKCPSGRFGNSEK